MGNMNGRRGFTVVLLVMPAILLFILVYGNSQYDRKNTPAIKAGILDLAGWDKDAGFRLTGEWELHPNLLLDTDEIGNELSNPTILPIPLRLKQVDIYGQPLPEYAKATYRIHVLNAPAAQELGIKIGELTTAYRLYIDDQLIAANGQFTDTPLTSISAYHFQMVPIPMGKQSFDIILQIANQYDNRGLIQWPVEFGDYHNLSTVDRFMSAFNLVMVGGLIAMSVTILFFSLIVPWKKELLILGAFGIATLFQLIDARHLFIIDLFPNISLGMLNKAHYMINYTIWFLLPASLAAIFPSVFPRWFLRPILIFPLVIVAYVALVPASIFTSSDWPDLVELVICFGLLFCMARAVLENLPGSRIIWILNSCAAALILTFAITGDSSLIYNIFTGSGLLFGTIIAAECITVSQNYIEARQLELSALKDQIRPHFVHNALAAIISISRTEPDRSRNLLVNFSTYLRGRFDSTSMEFVSIEQELETIKAYVALEQARFGSRLQVQYQIEAENFLLPPLILQPLVENAVVHGMQGGTSGISILVYIRHSQKMVRIGVRDDGLGINAKSSSNSGRKGVGLDNINRRLTKIYGSQLHYLAPANGGCDVYMEIPCKEVPRHESYAG